MNEKIRKYLDNELSGEDLIIFEKEINNSPELKKEIESYKNSLLQFKKLNNVNANESYFTDILPRFREEALDEKKIFFKPSFVVGSIILILVAAAMFFLFNNQNQLEDEQITLNQLDLENEELSSYLDNYSQDLSSPLPENIPAEYDSILNSLIEEEINLNGNIGENIVDVTSYEFFNMLGEFSEEEINTIYSSIANKDFN